MNPLCTQSISNKIAKSSAVGAWMNSVSRGRLIDGGYRRSVRWIDSLTDNTLAAAAPIVPPAGDDLSAV